MGFFNDLLTGLIRPKKYKELLKKGFTRVIAYAVILIFISSVITVISLSGVSSAAKRYYNEVVPDFTFKNNELVMSEPFKLEFMGMIIAADSNTEFTTQDLGNNIQGILFDKNSMILRSAATTNEVAYTDLTNDNITFSKEDIYLISPTLKIFWNAFITLTVIFGIASFFFGALIVALLALIPNRVSKLSFKKLYMIAIYSRGLPIILSLVLGRFIGGIPVIVSFIISMIIVNIALNHTSPDTK